MAKRIRSLGSVRTTLVKKAREAAIAAIRSYNEPATEFKSETYIVLMVIAWTHLLHAYYRGKGLEYRYFRAGQSVASLIGPNTAPSSTGS